MIVFMLRLAKLSCTGKKPNDPTLKILFWHRGMSTGDIALGAKILERARELRNYAKSPLSGKMNMDVLILDGSSLSMDRLVHAAKTATEINLEPVSLHRMADARRILEYAIDTGTPIYGVTRGLGSKASEVLNKNELTDFSKKRCLAGAYSW